MYYFSYYFIHSHFTGKILSVTNSLVCKRKYVACPGWKRGERGGMGGCRTKPGEKFERDRAGDSREKLYERTNSFKGFSSPGRDRCPLPATGWRRIEFLLLNFKRNNFVRPFNSRRLRCVSVSTGRIHIFRLGARAPV